MLSIRRCPTQLSIHQDDQEVSPTSIVRQLAAPGACLRRPPASHLQPWTCRLAARGAWAAWRPPPPRAALPASTALAQRPLRRRYARPRCGGGPREQPNPGVTSSDVASPGAVLPLLRFAVHDTIAKRLRSFGDLQSVLDMNNAPGCVGAKPPCAHVGRRARARHLRAR